MAKPAFDLSPRKPPVQDADLSALLGLDNRAAASQITQLPLGSLRAYPNQPFKPYREEKLAELTEDIRANGVINPIIVRPKGSGYYEVLAGHNRWNASRRAGLSTIPAIIREVDDDTAALIMVNTNLNQRDELLPSEKAFAYKIQLDTMKRQGERTDLTSSQVGMKLQALDMVGQQSGDSRNQVHRYIRLTYLIPELLQLVDEKQLALVPAVSLSYLTAAEQEIVLEATADIENKISMLQASKIREAVKEGLTIEKVLRILEPEKAYNPKNEFLTGGRDLIPKTATQKDIWHILQYIQNYFGGRANR